MSVKVFIGTGTTIGNTANISAGQGEKYSRPLRNLKVGDRIFAYMAGFGYVGYGEVTKEATPVTDFVVEGRGKLLELSLRASHVAENSDSPMLSEWAVGIRWLKAYPREESKTFKGAFANPNIVCKLRDPKTLQFLHTEFGVADRDQSVKMMLHPAAELSSTK